MAKKFDDVVKMLRDSFCPSKPAWRIYAEIMEVKQQRGEATDSFIRKKRALFAKLTKSPSENDQIDIIFGMLSIDIRDRVFRHKVSSFDDLLKDAREAENVIAERQNNDGVKPKTSGSVRCAFCHRKGHKVEDCFKKKHVEDEGRRNAISTARENTSKPKLACYGCNAPGIVRANCPNCKSKKDGTNDTNVAYFNRICSDLVQSEIPLVNIKFFGCLGQVIIDTGARMSVASANMKEIMDCNGCTFHSLRMDISLADGSRSVQECLATTCKMEIGRKTVDIQFVVLPN
uniref:Peptidase A2 domain-containing protein n=1 Tax=Musca domestica TaxID=7370 RepID=A0A1I8NJ43_MUSDO